jgi:hypothetical protein
VTVRLLAYVSGDLDPPGGASEQVVAPGERTSFALSELDVEPDQVLVVESDGAVFAQRVLLTETGRSLAPGIRG